MTNRRNFLKTALAGSAALAASSAMALPTDRPEKFDETYDVIVVGAGGSGLAAAAHAAEKGLKVLILEKMAFPGGSSAICGGGSLVVGTDLQKKAGEKTRTNSSSRTSLKRAGASTTKTSCTPSSTITFPSTTGSWVWAGSSSPTFSLRA